MPTTLSATDTLIAEFQAHLAHDLRQLAAAEKHGRGPDIRAHQLGVEISRRLLAQAVVRKAAETQAVLVALVERAGVADPHLRAMLAKMDGLLVDATAALGRAERGEV